MFPCIAFAAKVNACYRAKARLRASEVGTMAEAQLCTYSGNREKFFLKPSQGGLAGKVSHYRQGAILHAALDETFFCACLRFGNKWTCACCCFSPADAATFASSPSTGTSVKVWNFRVNKLSNSARWSLCACARHCWIAA